MTDHRRRVANAVRIAKEAHSKRLLQDIYPTSYLPHVGRQVMQQGGVPDDLGAVYDPMGNVAIPPMGGVSEPGLVDSAMEKIARGAAAIGAPLRNVAQRYTEDVQNAAKESAGFAVDSARRSGEAFREGRPLDAVGQTVWQALGNIGVPLAPLTGAAKTAGHYATHLTGNPQFGERVEAVGGLLDPTHIGALKAAAPLAVGATAASRAVQTAKEVAKTRELNPLGLYSHGAETAQNLPQAKGTVEQIAAMLQKQGVKPAEMEGFTQAFSGKPSITKDEAAEYFKNRMPNIEETVLGGSGRTYPYSNADEWQQAIDAANARRDFNDAERLTSLWEEAEGVGGYGAPKFAQYTIPGGSNYREVLLKLPVDREANAQVYKSSHWDEPNVVAHVRMSDRELPDGQKVLHVEEIQSDWAQEGRKKGFKGSQEQYDAALQEATKARDEILDYYNGLPDRHRPTDGEINGDISRMAEGRLPVYINPEGEAKPLVERFISTYKALDKLDGGLPAAPYVTNTQAWTDLALKRALKEAADGGYPRMIWTPGADQAARYDLAKQVDEIRYVPSTDGKTVNMEVMKGGRNVLNRPSISVDELEGMVGKETAEKIVKGEGKVDYDSGYTSLSGLDLSVGGEGMKSYYDKIVPTQLQKIIKKLDPNAKIEMTPVPGIRESQVAQDIYVERRMLAQYQNDLRRYESEMRASQLDGDEAGAARASRLVGFAQDNVREIEKKIKELEAISTPKPFPSIQITPKMREAIQAGLPHMADGGTVE